jgi:hypothetical protein
MTKRISIEVVEERVKAAHGDVVTLNRETYVGVAKKATFVDRDYGEWTAFVTNVTLGHGHPARGHEQSQQTNIQKYGSISPLGNSTVRKKLKATNVERYGVENVLCRGSSVRDTVKETMVIRYGVDNPQKVPSIKEKTKATHLLRHGVEFPYQSDVILKKAQGTYLKNYGVINPMQALETREKAQQTCLDRYGVRNPAQDPEIYKRSQASKVTVVQHWKTSEELQCRCSYELAVVTWLNERHIDFDWQIPFAIPNADDVHAGIRGRVYYIDLLLKDGELGGTYVEVKGRWRQDISKLKWEWFNHTHPTAQLWTNDVLRALGILGGKTRKKAV